MPEYDPNACHDYNTVSRRLRRLKKQNFWGGMNRRQFMARSVATVGGAAVASGLPAWLQESTFAQGASSPDCTFIFLHMFGAPDGLAMCSPYNDPDWFNLTARQQLLSVPLPGSPDPTALVDLDGFFGLAGPMANGSSQVASGLKAIWDAGDLAIAAGVTLQNQSYSHFTGEFWVAQSTPNPTPGVLQGQSMLERMLSVTGPGGAIRGASIASNLHDHLLGGAQYKALPIPNAENFGVQGLNVPDEDAWLCTLVDMYNSQTLVPEWQDLATATKDAKTLLDAIPNGDWNPPGYNYDSTYVGNALRRVGVMLSHDIPLETITIRTGGWDTHNNQGNNSVGGAMYGLMESLSSNLHEFWRYMNNVAPNKCWIIYMIGEFGREAEPEFDDGMGGQVNPDTAGTDHGYGTNTFMIGPRVCGGQVVNIGLWPGLASLHSAYTCTGSNDVCANTDSRIYLVEIMDRLMGVNHQDLSFLFPEYNVPSPAEYHGVIC